MEEVKRQVRVNNLRNLPSNYDCKSLVAELEDADVVRVQWPNGGGELIKGEERLRRIVEIGKPEQLAVLLLGIANTTQAELLAAALQVMASEGGLSNQAVTTLRDMLVTASTIPASNHDDAQFQVALEGGGSA
jgi:hypothetical protein